MSLPRGGCGLAHPYQAVGPKWSIMWVPMCCVGVNGGATVQMHGTNKTCGLYGGGEGGLRGCPGTGCRWHAPSRPSQR